jgi:hypothetical protein
MYLILKTNMEQKQYVSSGGIIPNFIKCVNNYRHSAIWGFFFSLHVDKNWNAARANWGEINTVLASDVLNMLKSCLAKVRRVFFLLSAAVDKTIFIRVYSL